MSPIVSMRLLGHFELAVDDEPVVLPAGPQRVAAYLALRGITPRGRLAGELWPETTQERAMGCLRTAIWRVNRATHGLVVAVGGALDLDPRAEVDVRQVLVDAGALLTSAARPPARSAPPSVDLLPTWEDEWLVHDRERVRQLQLHLLEMGAQRLAEAGDYALALEWALGALRADPLRETAHRAVIAVHLAEGNLTEARRAFDACADLLSRELGVRPTPRTAQLLASGIRDVAVTVP